MNGRWAKKIRRETRRAGWEYLDVMCSLRLGERLGLCWAILWKKVG